MFHPDDEEPPPMSATEWAVLTGICLALAGVALLIVAILKQQ